MKRTLPAFLRGLICSVALLLMHFGSFASHIVGCDLFYAWVSGNTYKVTVILYGNCGPASSAAFSTLPTSSPQVCIYDGNTYTTSISLAIQAPSAGVEITPVCPADSATTQCHISSSTIPGIKKFVYTQTVTLPHLSRYWRFVYNGSNGSGSAAGRAASITNLGGAGGPGSSIMQLIDTLNNIDPGVYAHNTSPLLTVVPTPFFCLNSTDCYNPGALDPDGDSLRFSLVAPTNGSGTTGDCTVGAAWPYAAGNSWPGQPLGAATPLQSVLAPPSFYFDPSTGQICFNPTVTQRSVVVYNIEEFRNDTMVGTCQREMTFVVLTCTNTAPVATTGGLSGLIPDTAGGLQDYHACGNIGEFCLTFNGSETDTANHITFTVTGLVTGMTYTVTANGTNHPTVTVCGNTDSLTPGLYNFYLHMADNNCPLTGNNTQAISINLYPVPTIRDSIAFPATCFHQAVVYIIPGGTGKPWTIDGYHAPLDTFQTFTNDSVMFIDSLPPTVGFTDTFTIFTNVSHACAVYVPIVIPPPPPINPVTIISNPTFCGAQNGYIIVDSLFPGVVDTVKYKMNGVWQPPIIATVAADSTIVIPNLLAGTYDSIIVTYGFCHSQYLGPDVLVNPPFPIRAMGYVNPSHCGYCDGSITLYGLNPNQLDTIYYAFNSVNTSISYFVGPDSMVQFSSLCDGSTYTNFYARTDSVCLTATLLGITLHGPPLRDTFNTDIHYGCHGDTVIFTNHNYSTADTNDVTFHWYFGDGYTDTAQNPTHIYTNNATDTSFIVKIYATNGECIDSFFHTLKLVNYIQGSFTTLPYPFVCQDSGVVFTNTSISLGTGPNNIATTYSWAFGDGNTSNVFSPVNTYLHTGTYNITMIQTNFVPCSDTVTQTLVVDTISGIKMSATDTVLCSGQEISFMGLYASEGNTGNEWGVTDGFGMVNVNPVLHSFDGAGVYTVTVTAKYRACPETTATRKIRVFSYPEIYLGPDTAICPGSNSITISDERNQSTPGATWLWSNGETSSQITVVKPGYYTAVVTIDGCSSSDTVWVQNDCYMNLPNVFSPNGDGVNDYFYPRQMLTRGLTSFNMNIYNRWGQLVYQTNSIDGRGWDGNFNNIPQPTGVYVYIIDATFKDGQVEHHQGNLTLLR